MEFTPAAFKSELIENILPFWSKTAVDPVNGGYFGSIDINMHVDNSAERSAVLYSRILWTFSRAYRLFHDEKYLDQAKYTLDYINQYFFDPDFGGVYWSVDQNGAAKNNRKHTYAQAFTIYGLSEYYLASGDQSSLEKAIQLYKLIESATHDNEFGGNVECRTREWHAEDDMRLSAKDMNCAKSMNTLLHLIEAYTNLILAWKDETLIKVQKQLVTDFLDHIINPETNHLKLFFGYNWDSLSEMVSYGHDIEASWLLVEAAEVLEDEGLICRTKELAVKMANAVYCEARYSDGSFVYEVEDNKKVEEKHWWVHAEAVVGFYNAFQINGEKGFLEASRDCWNYIQQNFIDQKNGDWFKVLDVNGNPLLKNYKVGPWECPYHHSRLCMEMIQRLPA